MTTMQQTFTDIFTVVGHNREESKSHAAKTLNGTIQLTLILLLASKEGDQRTKLDHKFRNVKSNNELTKIIKENFSEDEIILAYQQASEIVMDKYFKEVSSHLSEEQKRRIYNIIQKLVSDSKRKS